MKGTDLLILGGIALLALGSRSSSPALPAGPEGPPEGLPPGSALPPGPYPTAILTTPGPHDRGSWRRYSAEVSQLAGETLRALGAGDPERIIGALAIAVLAMRETSGASEHGNNPGNIAASQRSTPAQPQANWPTGRFRGRVFASRRAGIEHLVQLLRGARYGPAWRVLVSAAEASEPIEAAIAGWLLAIDDAGYTAAPQGVAERQARLAQSEQLARMVATEAERGGL